MSKQKRDLNRQEWEAIGRLCREASAAFSRIGSALLHTEPVAVYDRWANVRHAMDGQRLKLQDLAYDQLEPNSRAADMFQWDHKGVGVESPDYGWPKPQSIRKRALTREEWVLVGDDVKRLQSRLIGVGMAVQVTLGISGCEKWLGLDRKIERLKCKLDDTICRQHPDWDRATHVLYGEPNENPDFLPGITPEIHQ